MSKNVVFGLENDRLIFRDFNEQKEEIIYDFKDIEHNYAAAGLERQQEIFSVLVRTIKEQTSDVFEQLLYTLVISFSMKCLAMQTYGMPVLTVVKPALQRIGVFVKLIRENNLLFNLRRNASIDLDDGDKAIACISGNFLEYLSAMRSDSFPLILIDIDLLKEDLESFYSECYRLLSKESTLLVFGRGPLQGRLSKFPFEAQYTAYTFDELGYLLYVRPQKSVEQTMHYGAVLEQIGDFNNEIIENIKFVMQNNPELDNEAWQSKIDAAISATSACEDFIVANNKVFQNPDIKYYINELKNAELDLKYEVVLYGQFYDDFIDGLFECYNKWIEQAY